MEIGSKSTDLYCKYCLKKLATPSGKKRHEKLYCKSNENRVVVDKKKNEFPCRYCSSLFSSVSSRNNHQKQKHESREYVIELYSEEYLQELHDKDKQGFYEESVHKKQLTEHGGKILEKNGLLCVNNYNKTDDNIPCSYCPDKFTTEFKKKKHEKQKHEIRPWECKYCSKQYGKKFILKRHIENFHKVEFTEKNTSIICNECRKSFSFVQLLRNHRVVDHGEDMSCISMEFESMSGTM